MQLICIPEGNYKISEEFKDSGKAEIFCLMKTKDPVLEN